MSKGDEQLMYTCLYGGCVPGAIAALRKDKNTMLLPSGENHTIEIYFFLLYGFYFFEAALAPVVTYNFKDARLPFISSLLISAIHPGYISL